MHTYHLLPLALLAGPAFARPSPPISQSANHKIPGIAQTSTDLANSTTGSSSAPNCTAEYVLPNSRDCGEVALAHGIQLGISESYFPSISKKCQTILRGYGICSVKSPTTASPSAFPTATPISAGSNNTASLNGTLSAPSNGTINSPSNGTMASNATLANNALNFTRFDASVLATKVVTSYDTKTLTYTMGTSGASDARTVVVTHTMSNTITFTTMATVVGVPSGSKAKPTASPSPTLVPARVVLQILPEGTSTITTEFREHGTYTALTTVASNSSVGRVNVKRETTTCLGSMAVAVEPSVAPVMEKRQVPTCANAVSAPAPTASGAVLGCSAWHVVVPGEDCATIPALYGITPATFKTWNPSLDASCYNLLTGIAYCVSRCGLTSEASSSDASAAVANVTAAVLPTTKSVNDGMWTPDAALKTSTAVGSMYPPATVSAASSWPASGYAPKSSAPVAPLYPQSGMMMVPQSSQSGMLKVPKPTQSAMAPTPQSIPSSMGAPGSFAWASVMWNGFGGGMSSATPSVNMMALPSATSASIEELSLPSTTPASSQELALPSASLAFPSASLPVEMPVLPSASSASAEKQVLPFSAPISLKASPELELPSALSDKLDMASVPSKKLEVSQNYSSNPVEYKTYSGDGSVAAGWPSMEEWLDFETMFEINKPDMSSGCATWGLPNDTEDEIASIKDAIKSVAATADGIDERFILAIIMQESKGCVRVVTTSWAHNNPGLMQTHQGTGSCNTPTVQTPCPDSEILQMVKDGTLGTPAGDGLQQCKQKQTAGQPDEASAWYRTARQYNGGSIAASGNLEEGCCTLTYASDVANRLVGWVHPPSTSA